MIVFNAANQGIMTTDEEGFILSVNPAFCKITGYTSRDVVGRNSSLLNSGEHEQAFFLTLWDELEQKGSWEGEIWNRRANGESYLQWLTISSVTSQDSIAKKYVSIFSDITERKKQEELI
jgi:PAS domain S-box-containing protein